MRTSVCAVAILLVGAASSVQAEVVTLTADRDNTLFEDATGSLSDGAGPVMFSGNNGQDLVRRALLRFDVAGILPGSARIDGVELRLNCSNAPNGTAWTFALHRLLRDWGEGTSSTTSGSGAAATLDDATWIHTFFPGASWSNPGGDFEPAASAALDVGAVGAYVWSGEGLKADVQSWLDGTTPNFGWLLQGDETAVNTARRFDSRENTTTVNRPTLTVQYSSNTTGVGAPSDSRPRLGGAFPNPGVGDVRVDFFLPARGHVRIDVSDVAGRRVATLVNGWREAGAGESRWDGRGSRGMLPPGVYLVRLIVDGRPIDSRTLARMD